MSGDFALLIVAVVALIEAVVQAVKPIYDKEKGWNVDTLIALGVSVLVCALGGLDVFEAVGFPLRVPVVGSVLTGFIVSRGGNVVHDLIGIINSIKTNLLLKGTSIATLSLPSLGDSPMGGRLASDSRAKKAAQAVAKASKE